MALTHHDDLELPAGDDWLIPGTLLDENGNPVVADTLEWSLLGPDGCSVFPAAGQFSIAPVPQQPGNISIFVGAPTTATFAPGRYTDAVRATIGGVTSNMWIGNILVAVNLFNVVCDPPPGD